MGAQVIAFTPEFVGDGFRIDPDQILEAAKGQKFNRLVIIADFDDEPGIYLAGSANAGECMILMEMAKRQIIEGQ